MEANNNDLKIELDELIAEGIYSNLAIISHSTSEFVIDFIRVMPGMPKAPVKSRIILTPEHAKRLLMSLTDNLAKYEAEFGKIKINTREEELHADFPLNFTSGEA